MSSVPVIKPTPSRMSFAQVAAAANSTRAANSKVVEHGKPIVNSEKPQPPRSPSLIVPPQTSSDDEPQPFTAQIRDQAYEERALSGGSKDGTDPSGLVGLLKATNLHEGNLQLSSSESIRKDNSDTKSTTSRVTFTMEEKESLRPDDSASMQAGLDEDTFSIPGSLVANSRVPSDHDARAFDDQLREINQTGLVGQLSQRNPALFLPSPQNGAIIYTSAHDVGSQKALTGSEIKKCALPDGTVIPPDEKLLEALRSPRDRVFVLKIEQDIIDFVKDPKEQQLHLPQTNSFYRMLTHKLADYYLLEHAVDETMTSVRLFRTANCRIPPPLIDINSSTLNTDTPPPNAPTRKIMRRGISGKEGKASVKSDGTVNSSNNPSKTTSEAETGSSSDDGNKTKDKAALTREERENRYKEARARIFKDFKEDDIGVPEGILDANGVSRASSVSASKKTTRQQRIQDDGFEARSAYTQYLPQPIPSPGFNGQIPEPSNFDNFSNFGQPGQYHNMPLSFPFGPQPPNSGHTPSLGGGGSVPQYGWNYQQFAPHFPGNQSGLTSDMPLHGGYASSATFQASMQKLPSPNNTSQTTPKMMSSPPATYNTNFQSFPHAQDQSSWLHLSYPGSFPNPGYGYTDPRNAAAGQASSTFQFHPMPMNGYVQHAQHDHSYQQQLSMNLQRQFNPLSQAFVPGTQGRPPQPFPTGFSQYNNYSGRFASPRQSPIMSSPQASALSSQYSQPNSNGLYNLPHTPPRTSNQVFRGGKPTQSSISKWGNPSTLPPKPPPPATSLQMPLMTENQLPLPPNPVQNLARRQSGESAPATGAL